MSDLIARMAARAVGERAAASPRVPSIFEAPGPAAGLGLEVIDEEIAASAPSRPAGHTPVAPRRARESRAPAAAPKPLAAETAATPVAPAAGKPTELSVGPPPSPPRRATDQTAAPMAEARPLEPVPAAHEERLAVAAAAPALTRAVPVLPPAPEHSPPMPAVAAPAEEPAVRVHIGRLEVRANLQEQPRRPERPPAPRRQELSLSDYLRGRRVTR